MQLPNLTWLSWIGSHWQALLAWLTGIITLSKAGRFFARGAISIGKVFDRFETAEQTLVLLATNHLPHLQVEMEKLNTGVADLQATSDKGNDTLIEIATILRERE